MISNQIKKDRKPKSPYSFRKVALTMLTFFIIWCVSMLSESNWGSKEFGAFFHKKHFVDEYFIKICDFTGDTCRESGELRPAVIEYNDPFRTSHVLYRVFVKSFTFEEKDNINTATFSTLNSTYSVISIIPPIKKRFNISGCEIDFYHASKCQDDSGRVWNIKLPFTLEVIKSN